MDGHARLALQRALVGGLGWSRIQCLIGQLVQGQCVMDACTAFLEMPAKDAPSSGCVVLTDGHGLVHASGNPQAVRP